MGPGASVTAGGRQRCGQGVGLCVSRSPSETTATWRVCGRRGTGSGRAASTPLPAGLLDQARQRQRQRPRCHGTSIPAPQGGAAGRLPGSSPGAGSPAAGGAPAAWQGRRAGEGTGHGVSGAFGRGRESGVSLFAGRPWPRPWAPVGTLPVAHGAARGPRGCSWPWWGELGGPGGGVPRPCEGVPGSDQELLPAVPWDLSATPSSVSQDTPPEPVYSTRCPARSPGAVP